MLPHSDRSPLCNQIDITLLAWHPNTRTHRTAVAVVPNLPILNDIWVARPSGICLFEVHQSRRKRGGEGEGHVAAGTSSMADLVLKLGETERGGWSPHNSLFERSFGGNIHLILAKAM